MKKICDTCKRILEKFYQWTTHTDKHVILFHGKNMGADYFTCDNSGDKDSLPYKCIRTIIEQLAEDDEKSTS